MRPYLCVLLALAGCESNFASRSIIEDYRVLGISAEPPELGPDDVVALTMHDVSPTESAVAYTWSMCLWSLGAYEGYRCVDPGLVIALPDTGPTAQIDFGALGFRQAYEALGPFYAPDGSALSLQDGLDVTLTVTSTVGARIYRTHKRVTIRAAETARNENPVVEELFVERLADRRVKLQARMAADAIQHRLDGEPEALLYTWYTTAGALDPPLTDVDSTQLRLPSDGQTVEVFVAVRDGRGGLGVASASISPE